MKTVKEVLTEARSLIETGWIKGKLCDDERICFCSEGAIRYAALGEMFYDGTASEYAKRDRWTNVFAAEGALVDVIYPAYNNVADWNDAPDTTHEDVYNAFTRAIEAC